MWAKCDMLQTVSFERLTQPYLKSRHGGRRYVKHVMAAPDLAQVQACIRTYLRL